MKEQQKAVLEAVQRADCLLEENAALVDGAGMALMRQRLAELRASFEANAVEQAAAELEATGETARQQQLTCIIRERHLQPIASIARAVRAEVPALATLRMPSERLWGTKLVVAARAMEQAAAAHRETFVSWGARSTFLDDLEEAIVTFERSLEARAASQLKRAGATKALDELVKRARAVLQVLDSLMPEAFADDEAALRRWESARTIHRRSGPKSSIETRVSLEIIPEVANEGISEDTPEENPVIAPVAGDSVLEAVLQATPSHPARISVLELLREEDTAA